MDPATALALAATCTSIAHKAGSIIKDLDELVTRYKNADKSARQLAARLRMFQVTVDQLEQWHQGCTNN
jgi:predicted nucleic acid-binding protein